MVVAQGMTLAITGLVVGTAAALIVTRLVATMLFGVGAADPTTFVAAAAFLSTVALIATWLPAFRATRLDPMRSLRR
jgi:ABC-type antimicrobial peptide transport system permease subunit